MTNEQLKSEFNRWLDAGRPSVWVKHPSTQQWYKEHIVTWECDKSCYIVDDKHAKLRSLQIDKPSTKFQMEDSYNRWVDVTSPNFDVTLNYSVKPTEWYEDPAMIGKPCWFRDIGWNKWKIGIFKAYSKEHNLPFRDEKFCWSYAKPVACDDLYKGEGNDKTK